MKQILKQTLPLFVVFGVLLSSHFISAAWTAPGGPPTSGNNAPAPINVSAENQMKIGSITAYRLYSGGNTSAGNNVIAENNVLAKNNVVADNIVRAPSYCDRDGNNCITPQPNQTGLTLECVTGKHKEGDSSIIRKSSLGETYNFSRVFTKSTINGATGKVPVLECKNSWTMTGCSASTEGNGNGDNDESMYGQNECRGDQVGTNVIYARCCRVVIE